QAMSVSPRAGANAPYTNWMIDRDVGDMVSEQVYGEPKLTFQRYEVRLEKDWLLGKGNGVVAGEHTRAAIDASTIHLDGDLETLQELVSLRAMPKLSTIARGAAEDQVSALDFPAAFDDIWTPSA
ncbi:MAG: hypothetical protein AAFR55_09930, partial [Pseudomonadota bacterium]